ncbi:hypothetical protein C7M46_01778 [Pediococcus pentosaceus]|uniref:hypothetical protein n=1 Tax=Pediococcus pentosaceus TaxID=1255 RepID=UPI001363C48D|nr:hypothetical protein [Pediococcus pentosaceus]QHM61064.1 hypothetical protein C7M46_01778 [Pediococcus pentosaceus]
MLSTRRIDDYVTNHVVDRSFRGINLRDLTDEEIEDNAQAELDRLSKDEMYDLLEDLIYDEKLAANVKARIFGIDTEVEIR